MSPALSSRRRYPAVNETVPGKRVRSQTEGASDKAWYISGESGLHGKSNRENPGSHVFVAPGNLNIS